LQSGIIDCLPPDRFPLPLVGLPKLCQPSPKVGRRIVGPPIIHPNEKRQCDYPKRNGSKSTHGIPFFWPTFPI